MFIALNLFVYMMYIQTCQTHEWNYGSSLMDEDFMKPIKYKKWVAEQEIMIVPCVYVI